jgi:hypothetical protein
MPRDAPAIAADIIKLAASGLFDARWYWSAYPAAAADGGDPLVHFCNSGWLHGLKPNFYFDTGRYLAQNDDVRRAGLNPLAHYLDYGEIENRAPSPHFDVAWYRRTYEIPAGTSCLAHYLTHRSGRAVNPNAGFDAAWYAAEYQVPAEADPFEHYLLHETPGADPGTDPSPEARAIRNSGLFDRLFYLAKYPHVEVPAIHHYCALGWRGEKCNPNELFDTAWYLSINDDVKEAGVNPLYHYIQAGEAENRRPCENFDPASYRAAHDIGAETSCLAHYLKHRAAVRPGALPAAARSGIASQADADLIEASELLDNEFYLLNYPDVRDSGATPLEHFCRYGWQEGRRPNPYFDPGWYRNTYLPGDETINPLAQYIRSGEKSSCRPIVYFDPDWYRSEYRIPRDQMALRHYLKNRRRQRFSPTPYFNIAYYVGHYGDEIGTNRDPFLHYLRVGTIKDVDPGPDFDVKAYRAAKMNNAAQALPAAGRFTHDQLQREALNPLVHFLLHEAAGPLPAAPVHA